MNAKSFLFCFLLSLQVAQAADITDQFQTYYNKKVKFSLSERNQLKKFRFVFIPGIMSEAFIDGDERVRINLSFMTKDYFSGQKRALERLGFETQRLSASSASAHETRELISNVLEENEKKIIFVTHSLGGIALLDELVSKEDRQDQVAGILFIQSPFYGAPMANVYLNNRFHLDRWLKRLLPWFNTSEETIRYLSIEERIIFMLKHGDQISSLTQRIPTLTVSGIANGYQSTFKASMDIMEFGCLKRVVGKCVTGRLFRGPYDLSDGMVPLSSSKLPGVDFVKLIGADHGETMLNIPFENYHKERLITSLLKLLHKKMKNDL